MIVLGLRLQEGVERRGILAIGDTHKRGADLFTFRISGHATNIIAVLTNIADSVSELASMSGWHQKTSSQKA